MKKSKKIYLDYASSASVDSANPGAIHELGIKEKSKLENARKNVADVLGAHSDEIVFTSGATESNNLALMGVIEKISQTFFPHIIITNIEHASVLEVCKHLEKTKQAEVTYVPVEENGIVDPKKIKKAIKKNTILVSVMYANNEIGTIQPIGEIAKEIRYFRKHKTSIFPLFHTDATQAINYLLIKVEKLGIDLMSFNGAKIYGSKGVGVLYVKRKTPISSIMFGGNQEFGLRPGTENVAGVVALKDALQVVEKIKEKEVKRLTKLRDYFLDQLNYSKILTNYRIVLNGDLKNRLPNNINITIPKIPSDLLVLELSARGIYISEKSACKSGDGKASGVIKAINPNGNENDGSLRFSLGRQTKKTDIDYTIKSLKDILKKLKKWYD
ncbi:MAG: cysteine desulfurase family protein [Candidatus Paceibacterota bacterium]|jgi:cysteine desulfurase